LPTFNSAPVASSRRIRSVPFGRSSAEALGAPPVGGGPDGAAPPPGDSAPYFFSAIHPAFSPENAKRWILSTVTSVPSARFRIVT